MGKNQSPISLTTWGAVRCPLCKQSNSETFKNLRDTILLKVPKGYSSRTLADLIEHSMKHGKIKQVTVRYQD